SGWENRWWGNFPNQTAGVPNLCTRNQPRWGCRVTGIPCWAKSAPGLSWARAGPGLLGIGAGSQGNFLQFAFAQQIHGSPVIQAALLLQKEEYLPPRIEAHILVEDLQHLLHAFQHMAVIIKLPARKPRRLQPLFP